MQNRHAQRSVGQEAAVRYAVPAIRVERRGHKHSVLERCGVGPGLRHLAGVGRMVEPDERRVVVGCACAVRHLHVQRELVDSQIRRLWTRIRHAASVCWCHA